MANTSVATAADYADAMLTARRVRNVLFMALMLIVLGQIAMFLTVKFTKALDNQVAPPVARSQAGDTATTQPATQAVSPTDGSTEYAAPRTRKMLQYATGLMGFAGIVLALLYSLVILLLVNIMLVGRLIGISYVVKSFIWSLLFAMLVFPWQAFLTTQGLDEEAFTAFKWPGVLYTWRELAEYGKSDLSMLKWGRFLVWPGLAVLILLTAQARSSRGLKLSLGEAELAAGPPARERPEA